LTASASLAPFDPQMNVFPLIETTIFWGTIEEPPLFDPPVFIKDKASHDGTCNH
jgi:hypothetical protein